MQITIAEFLNEMNIELHKMPDFIFRLYDDRYPETKCFYNLIADCFLDLQGYAALMINSCWLQAGAILRIAFEQISSFIVLVDYPDIQKEYFKFFYMKNKYHDGDKNYRNQFAKERHLSKNNINSYLDFGWFQTLNKDNKYSRDLVIKKAGLLRQSDDIFEFLNNCAHGDKSIFEFNGGEKPWDDMRYIGKKMDQIMIDLLRKLYCSFKKWLGIYQNIPSPIDKVAYNSYFVNWDIKQNIFVKINR